MDGFDLNVIDATGQQMADVPQWRQVIELRGKEVTSAAEMA